MSFQHIFVLQFIFYLIVYLFGKCFQHIFLCEGRNNSCDISVGEPHPRPGHQAQRDEHLGGPPVRRQQRKVSKII